MKFKNPSIALVLLIIVIVVVIGSIYFIMKSMNVDPNSKPDILQSQVGQEITLQGVAVSSTAGPVFMSFTQSGQTYSVVIPDISQWPADAVGKEVLAKGILAKVNGPSQMVPGTLSYQLLQASYSLK